jgi:hypothetical protein
MRMWFYLLSVLDSAGTLLSVSAGKLLSDLGDADGADLWPGEMERQTERQVVTRSPEGLFSWAGTRVMHTPFVNSYCSAARKI